MTYLLTVTPTIMKMLLTREKKNIGKKNQEYKIAKLKVVLILLTALGRES